MTNTQSLDLICICAPGSANTKCSHHSTSISLCSKLFSLSLGLSQKKAVLSVDHVLMSVNAMINTCKHIMTGELWKRKQLFRASLASQSRVMPPSLSSAEQQEVTSSQPRGRFSNSRTLRAVCEGMAGAAINTKGTGAAERWCLWEDQHCQNLHTV